ncbi:MAG: RsmD family RNA methyltransferase [Bacteroidota bacterium]
MRIISGKYKGKRIFAPKKLPVRPTTDMAKEALFNILNNRRYFEAIDVLDLFSGTGNISFEFASRGTKSITAVDINPGCIQFINKISKELDFPIDTVKMYVFIFLDRTKLEYDIIFSDPPYHFNKEQFLKIPELVFKNNLLNKKDGVLIVEHSSQTLLDSHPNFVESRKYGSTIFSFFES